jgi:hypothetical protein
LAGPSVTRWTSRILLALVALVALAKAAHAAEPYVVTYRAPPGCPTEDAFLKDLAASVREPERAAGARFEIIIAEHEGRFTGDLTVTDAAGVKGHRRVEDTACTDVARALAFMTSMAIKLGGRIEAPDPPPPPPRPPPPRAPPVAPPPPRPAPPPSGIEVTLAAAVGIVSGIAPGLRPAADLSVGLGDRRVRVLSPWVSLSARAAQSTITNDRGALELAILEGRLFGCPLRLGGAGLFVRPCIGAALGAAFASSSGIEGARSVTTLRFSVDAGLHAQWNATAAFFVQLEGGPSFRLRRGEYYFHGPNTGIYTEPTVAAWATLGAGVRF